MGRPPKGKRNRPCRLSVSVSLEVFEASHRDREAERLSEIVDDLLRVHYKIGKAADPDVERLQRELETLEAAEHPIIERKEALRRELDVLLARQNKTDMRASVERALREEAARIHAKNPQRPASVWLEWLRKHEYASALGEDRALDVLAEITGVRARAR